MLPKLFFIRFFKALGFSHTIYPSRIRIPPSRTRFHLRKVSEEREKTLKATFFRAEKFHIVYEKSVSPLPQELPKWVGCKAIGP